MIAGKLASSILDRGVGPLFLTPSVLLLVVLLLGPFVYMVGISFTDLSYALPGHDGNFLGFDNYRRLVRDDPVFWESFRTTMVFVFGVVSTEFLLGFALALLLFHHIQRRRIVLTLLLIPMMIAPVAVGLMWKLMLHGEFGMLTHYLRALGLLDPQTALLGNHNLVLWTVMLVDVWEWTPFVTLVILAGLLSLPRELTLPLLRPIIALVMLLRGIDAFKEFDKVFILTGGGPGNTTELLSIYTWR
ncbi:MAG: carbohydrate ABC transporter permease, partial [Alphaproteobacteria bacterium]